MKLNKRIVFIISIMLVLAIGAATVIMRFIISPKDKPIDFMSDGVLRVCLDAGHGGDDPGAVSTDGNRLEKDDVLRLMLEVVSRLEEDYPAIEIVTTRDDDVYPTLEERCVTANDSKSDLFVSFHRNSAEGAKGTEVWAHSDAMAEETLLASKIMDGLAKVGVSSNRGVKYGTANNPESNYYVNNHTKMPSCIVELGFITSDTDNALYDENLTAYAQAIADAIAKVLGV